MKCSKSPIGCIEGGKNQYVYEVEWYVENNRKLQFQSWNLMIENDSVVLYQRTD